MGYLAFFSLNFICVCICLKFLEASGGLNATSSMLALVCVWVIPTWRWSNCLWQQPVNTMPFSLLIDIHNDWTKTIGFKGGKNLQRVSMSNNKVKILTAKKRVLDIKKELLVRYEKMGSRSNGDLIESIKFLEKEISR